MTAGGFTAATVLLAALFALILYVVMVQQRRSLQRRFGEPAGQAFFGSALRGTGIAVSAMSLVGLALAAAAANTSAALLALFGLLVGSLIWLASRMRDR